MARQAHPYPDRGGAFYMYMGLPNQRVVSELSSLGSSVPANSAALTMQRSAGSGVLPGQGVSFAAQGGGARRPSAFEGYMAQRQQPQGSQHLPPRREAHSLPELSKPSFGAAGSIPGRALPSLLSRPPRKRLGTAFEPRLTPAPAVRRSTVAVARRGDGGVACATIAVRRGNPRLRRALADGDTGLWRGLARRGHAGLRVRPPCPPAACAPSPAPCSGSGSRLLSVGSA